MRLRRTLLWVPGNKWNMINEAIESEADCIVMDLEDLVHPKEKSTAREMVAKALSELDFKKKEKIVRINPINTELGEEDIKGVVPFNPDAIRLPKCETTDYVLILDEQLSFYEEKYGFAKNSIEIILMIESALGVRNAYELASCTERVTAIGLGAEDLTANLRTKRTTSGLQLELLYARQKLIIDGRAAGVDVIDSSCLVINEPEDLKKEIEMVKQLGFDGKSVSHISQLSLINEAFNPSIEEIQYAQKVISAFDKAKAAGSYYTILDGKKIDPPVVEKSEQVLEVAKSAGLLV